MKTLRGALLVSTVLFLAACSAAGGPSPSPSSSPSLPAVTSPDEAAARVQAEHPELAGLKPPDPNLIGGCCWYEATAVEGGYQVVFTVGWGDCPAGCINRHRWTFAIAPDGRIALIGEEGPAVPPSCRAARADQPAKGFARKSTTAGGRNPAVAMQGICSLGASWRRLAS